MALQTDTEPIHILLVEDDEVDAMLVRRTLAAGAAGTGHLMPAYDLRHVCDLHSALGVLQDERVDVVLLDLNLVQFRGLETFMHVHENAPDVPVVVLTGLADDEIAIQAIRRGAQDFLIKEQLDPRLLGRTVRYALERQHLQEVQRKAQQYLDVAAVVFVVVDADERVSLINNRGCEILGYSESEIIGSNWFDRFIPERIREPMRGVFRGLIRGDELLQYYENPVQTAQGNERLLAWHNTVLRDGQGHFAGILSSGEDITERRLAELSLAESQRRMATLLANLPGMAYRCENNPSRTMQFLSEGARELTGHPPEAFIGDRELAFVDVIHPGDRSAVWDGVQTALSENRPFELEFRLRTADGRERWMMEVGRGVETPGGELVLEGIITDISARKEAEQAMRRYLERLRTLQAMDRDILAAQSPQAIAQAALASVGKLIPDVCCASVLLFNADATEATVLAANTRHGNLRAGRQLGIRGSPNLERLQAGETAVVEDIHQLETLTPLHRAMLDGGVRAYAAVPLMVEGELLGTFNLLRSQPLAFGPEDTSIARELADSVAIAIRQGRLFEQVQAHSRELERRVAERTKELRETNAELEAFAYSVSHDLRNPLWNAQAYLGMLRDSFGDQAPASAREYIDGITDAVHAMDSLIEELLTYSRVSRAQVRRELVPLGAIAARALEELAASIQASGAQITIAPEMPVVLGHVPTLERVLANLLGNAIKYVGPGVTPRIRVSAERRNGRVRLWVEDNGIGVPAEAQERIFRVFERASPDYPGSGIGLATVRRGVERLGGEVGVESVPGQGSRFWVELPGVDSGD